MTSPVRGIFQQLGTWINFSLPSYPPESEIIRDSALSTPLHLAAYQGDLDEVKELVRSGADLGVTDSRGWTPLMLAVMEDKEDTAAFLAKKMTVQELNVVDMFGYNVLHLVVLRPCPWSQIMQVIVFTCPSLLRQKNSSGRRPIDTARVMGQGVYDILERIEQKQQLQQQQEYTSGIANNEEKPCNITITVVGHHGVGKSCFVRQLKQESIPEGGPGSTDTADFYVNIIGYNPDTGFRQTLDENGEMESGRQRLQRIIARYREEKNTAAQLSADTPDENGDKEEASASTQDIYDDKSEVSVDAPMLSPRKKTEEVQQQEIPHQSSENPSSSEVQQEAITQKQNRRHISSEKQNSEIEAVMLTKTDDDGEENVKGFVTIYDFGGEKVFYNTHHCFMSSNMIFVLVFDVAMCLDPLRQKDGYERIEFWLRSIATYAIDRAAHGKGTPPIILVGSHLDSLSRNKEDQQHLFASVLEKLYEKPDLGAIMETHVQEMFPIADLNDSTKNQATYQQIWKTIIDIAPLQSQWMKPVPARWVAFEHELVRLKNDGKVILTYNDLLEINRKLAVPLVEDDIMKFLWKMKCFGSFLCFDLHNKKPFIALQAQWIINAFKAIITDPRFITELTMKQKLEWRAYEKSGVLPVEFIRKLWGRHEEFRFLEEEDTLYIALETLGLLSKPLSVDAEVNYFIVPSILQTADPELIRPVLDDPDTVTTVALCLKFDNPFIPQAVWDKMIAACIHRFQRLEELGLDGSKFIQRGFACLQVNSLWKMIILCKNNAMKMVMFTRSRDQEVLLHGTGISLRKIMQGILMRILELNNQSHLEYQFYLHNDYRFTPGERMVRIEDLHQRESVECYSSDGSGWIHKNDLYVWFEDDKQKMQQTDQRYADKTKDLPDRNLSSKEIGRLSRYILGSYLTFFVDLDCPEETVEQDMIEHRHLTFRSRITKVFLHLRKMKVDISFGAIADAMSKHGMDSAKLMNTLDTDRNVNSVYDETLPDRFLQQCLSMEDASNIADHVDIKAYFNFFLELGISPAKVDDFDDQYRHVKTRVKVTAMLEAFIKEIDPCPTVNTILLAIQECDMDTESLIAALKSP
ncbi:uncharacterized protein LOC110447279 [Mizuhopecten yessoensis]|uniref:uncharacterized protein LOC110447279 n=1 Tax=Mizuhopecten yessoensis TaxID=6573 RepID=UPI000B45E866|nr:uncharacterized protein LOC110447279 [Mizuhopecten yessoensis]